MKKKKLQIPELHQPGIYAIHCIKNNRYYVGSSVDVYQRVKLHYSHVHGPFRGINEEMRKDVEKYGAKSFVFEYLEIYENETITDKFLRDRELYNIKKYNAFIPGYNSKFHDPVVSYHHGKDELIKSNYTQSERGNNKSDRVSATLPKGTKERIKATGYSLNNFIAEAVKEKLEQLEAPGTDAAEQPDQDSFPMNPPEQEDDIPDCFK